MLLIKQTEKLYFDYIDRLKNLTKERVTDEEYTGFGKPTNVIFNNSKRVISILCRLNGSSSYIASSLNLTYDGKFQIIMSFDTNRGEITVEEFGFRCYNSYTRKKKFISNSYSNKLVEKQIKKYMKNYF